MIEKISDIGIKCPQWVYESSVCQNIISLAQKSGLKHHFYDSTKSHTKSEYFGQILHHSNVICWRYFHSPHQNYLFGSNNVLFIDDGLAFPRSSLYVDHLGFGGASSLVLNNENKREITPNEQMHVHSTLNPVYNLFHGPKKDGPIVVAIHADSDLVHICHEMLPTNVPVHFLPAPSLKGRLSHLLKNMYFKKHPLWTLLDGPNAVEEVIGNATALVTSLDRAAFIGLAKGIPTATFGRGLWSGCNCTLNCFKNPKMLRAILSYDFDHDATSPYLSCILRNQLSFSDAKQNMYNSSLRIWLDKTGIKISD